MKIFCQALVVMTLTLAPGNLQATEAITPILVGDPAVPEKLQDDILAAYFAGHRHIAIKPGIYVISGPIGFTGLQDAEISAYGVELAVDHVDRGALILERCRNVVFKGATLRHTRPRTGQAKIIALGEDGEGDYCDIQLEPGFPEDATFKITGVVDGTTLLPKSDGGSALRLDPLGRPGLLRLRWAGDGAGWKKSPDKTVWAKTGDYLICRTPGGNSMMCYAKGSQFCTFEDITIYWGGQFGFYETHGASANRYVRCVITYGPVPPGGVMRPLASQSADGLHSGGSLVGPSMENCYFEGQMDDGVNIHGSFYQIAKTKGARLTLGFPVDFLDAAREYEAGDIISLYDFKKHTIAERTIVAIEESQFVSARHSSHQRFRNSPMHYVELVLDEEVELPFDSVAWFPKHGGAGYAISGCTVRNSWCRGFLLKADDGTVSDSVLEGTLAAGIVLSTEMNWAEAGYSRRVTVRGNTLRNCGRHTIGILGGQAGGMVVTSTGMQGQGHDKITIRNNIFENIDLTNLVVRWARNVEIRDNLFIGPLLKPSSTGDIGTPFGIDGRAVIWIDESDGVTLSGNKIINPGARMKSGLAVSPTATDVQGSLDPSGK
jgi:hypothetical protein